MRGVFKTAFFIISWCILVALIPLTVLFIGLTQTSTYKSFANKITPVIFEATALALETSLKDELRVSATATTTLEQELIEDLNEGITESVEFILSDERITALIDRNIEAILDYVTWKSDMYAFVTITPSEAREIYELFVNRIEETSLNFINNIPDCTAEDLATIERTGEITCVPVESRAELVSQLSRYLTDADSADIEAFFAGSNTSELTSSEFIEMLEELRLGYAVVNNSVIFFWVVALTLLGLGVVLSKNKKLNLGIVFVLLGGFILGLTLLLVSTLSYGLDAIMQEGIGDAAANENIYYMQGREFASELFPEMMYQFFINPLLLVSVIILGSGIGLIVMHRVKSKDSQLSTEPSLIEPKI